MHHSHPITTLYVRSLQPLGRPHVDDILRIVTADMASCDIFYKKLIGAAAPKNVTSRFAMEKIEPVPALAAA